MSYTLKVHGPKVLFSDPEDRYPVDRYPEDCFRLEVD